VNKSGSVWGIGITEKVVWAVVKECAAKAGITKLAPHDLRRTCAKLCHVAGGELEQIQFLLGHVSVQTTEHYLGCQQRLKNAVNDCIGIEPQEGASAAELPGHRCLATRTTSSPPPQKFDLRRVVKKDAGRPRLS
jgi:hypothetical protein